MSRTQIRVEKVGEFVRIEWKPREAVLMKTEAASTLAEKIEEIVEEIEAGEEDEEIADDPLN